jgi:hypothetical protein
LTVVPGKLYFQSQFRRLTFSSRHLSLASFDLHY